tara:strand:+ start:4904 stop:5293 length:390 start_codon:yes stop_codon:yes gene_type:complete
MSARIDAELSLLRQHYADVEHRTENGMHWFSVQFVNAPDGWMPAEVPVIFAVTEGHPGAQPYGFFVPVSLSLNGKPPSENPAPHPPPFKGEWRFLSWQPVDWRPTGDVRTGSNLWGWVRSFHHRLREGL